MASISSPPSRSFSGLTRSGLGRFQCRFQKDDGECAFKRIYPDYRLECPFGHRRTTRWFERMCCMSAPKNKPLQPLPNYICFNHLIGQCSSGQHVSRNLSFCTRGMHPTSIQLRNCDDLVTEMAKAWTLHCYFQQKSCDICHNWTNRPHTTLPNYGYLSGQCSAHVFHAECLIRALEQNRQCPVCATPVQQVLFSVNPIKSSTEKATLFYLQSRTARLLNSDQVQEEVEDEQIEANENEVDMQD